MVNKQMRLALGIVMLIILPLLCFWMVYLKGGTGRVKLPRYYGGFTGIGTKEVRGKLVQDTIWHVVPPIELTNQLGEKVDFDRDLQNRFIVMNFFFSRCNSTCPASNSNLKFLQKSYQRKADTVFQAISITVDPVNDSFPALRNYANGLGVNHDKWWFCTGDFATIKNYMVHNLMMPDVEKDTSKIEAGEHSNMWVLLDRERNIRGYYNALDSAEVRRCRDDISLLILEKKRLAKQNEK
ncbi:MAG: hypothetical protein RL660_2229 [Bacteroidota bacterium]|jgi:protein SCO1/2